MQTECMLDIKNVEKSFGKKKIIKNINLKVNSGEVFGFLGPNGAGKSTTIKMILGLLSIDSGNILINGYDIKKEYEKALMYIGGIVENPDMYGYLSGLDNLKLHARIYNIDDQKIDDTVKLVGLEARIKDKVSKYSLGMKQRLGVALALLHSPKILVLDEPTNGLDPAGIRNLRDILKNLAHEKGTCVFVSSHLLSEMQLMCDRVAVIDSGKIIKVETLQNVLENVSNNDESIYQIETDSIDSAEKFLEGKYKYNIDKEKNILNVYVTRLEVPNVIKLLVQNDVKIYDIERQKQSLEDAFINITKGGGKID